MQPTIETLRKHQAELIEKFGVTTNVAYANVSYTQFSIARHYGGCKIDGKHYVYNPADDSLIREDVVKWLVQREKPAKTTNKATAKKPRKGNDASAQTLF